MEPGSSRPAQAGIRNIVSPGRPDVIVPPGRPDVIVPPGRPDVIVADPAWRRLVRRLDWLCARAAAAGGGAGSVVLTSDREVKRLNARFRHRNKPTNVLTFEHDIVLASGTVRREARASGRRISHHLAHLVVHGALHLRGFLHDAPADARRMEMAETRLLRRLGVPNPWRPGR